MILIFSMVKKLSTPVILSEPALLVIACAKVLQLAFCFIPQRNAYVNVCWQDFAIWFVPLEIQASEASFEKFNEEGSNTVFNTLRVHG